MKSCVRRPGIKCKGPNRSTVGPFFLSRYRGTCLAAPGFCSWTKIKGTHQRLCGKLLNPTHKVYVLESRLGAMAQTRAQESAANRPRRGSRLPKQTPTKLSTRQENPRGRRPWRSYSEHREVTRRRGAHKRQRDAGKQGSILGDGGEERRDWQEAGETLCQETQCKVLGRKIRFSYGALAPVGLADFLEGELNIDQLVGFGTAEARAGERSRSPLQWYWDRPMPDIVTGVAKARTPLTEFQNVSFPAREPCLEC